jgi:UDP-glucose 4-epimerase
MTKRYFITGIAGFLGSHIADALLAAGHEVAGNDNMLGGYADNVPSGAEFHEVDCTDLDAMTEVLQGSDVVYHCAASAQEGLSVFSPVLITRDNVQASVSVFTAAIRSGVKRIVYCSSAARYGDNAVPYTEEMEPRPQDPYGIAKVAAEQLLRNLCDVHGVEWCIAVPHNIVGPRQNQQPVIYGDGEQRRTFSPVDDCVDTLLALGESDRGVGQIVNIGPDDDFITINELARRIASQLEFEMEPIYVDPRPQEVKLSTCSSDKARRLFGYEPTSDLAASLSEIIAYVRKRGPQPFDILPACRDSVGTHTPNMAGAAVLTRMSRANTMFVRNPLRKAV